MRPAFFIPYGDPAIELRERLESPEKQKAHEHRMEGHRIRQGFARAMAPIMLIVAMNALGYSAVFLPSCWLMLI